MVPEQHTSMTTTLKHLKANKTPPSMQMLPGLSIAPTVQAIVVNGVSIVDPQLAAIIRQNAEMVMAGLEDSQAASPTHSKVITSFETAPFLACVAIVHCMAPAGHVGFATLQVLTPAALAKVKGILHEQTMTISNRVPTVPPATCTNNGPSVTSISTSVPEQHTSITTTFKHFESHQMPTTTKFPVALSITPAMQTIIVDCVAMVNPQLTAIIGENTEPVVARPEDSQTACPTHSEVICACKT